MQKLQSIAAGKTFKIVHYGNGNEPLFFEPANKTYFIKLIRRHLLPVCEILDHDLKYQKIELILRFRPYDEIPEKYRNKLHQPISNMFNSYAKSINKRYGRKGSLFQARFERSELSLDNF